MVNRSVYSPAGSRFQFEVLIGAVKFFEAGARVAQTDSVGRSRLVNYAFAVVSHRKMQLAVVFMRVNFNCGFRRAHSHGVANRVFYERLQD